jgi:hypothetical protein
MEQILPLNEKQLDELNKFDISTEHKPFRILTNGQAVNLVTGILCSRNSNILYHPIYWDRPKALARKAKEFLELNNPGIKFKITYH